MIAFIEGTLEEKGIESVVIGTGGIGYEIKIPLNVLDALPQIGQAVRLYTYLQVREDALGLFGFLSRNDLDFFKLLITVNGIGPKAALGIMSAIPVSDLRFAILAGDAKAIAKAPGIGGKTASKVILELKDKVQQMAVDNISSEFGENAGTMSGSEGENITGDKPVDSNPGNSSIAAVRRDAVEALTALGYGTTQAYQAVSKVILDDEMKVEDVLKLALKNLYQ